MIDNKTYYQILDVEQNASFEKIKKSYRKLSFLYHPDKNPSKEEEFKKINEAYEVLSDPQRRQEYDMKIKFSYFGNDIDMEEMDMNFGGFMGDILGGMLNSKFNSMNRQNQKNPNAGGIEIDNLFKMFSNIPQTQHANDFENVFMFSTPPERQNTYHQVPEDLRVENEITFEESYFGCCIPIKISREIKNGKKTYSETEKVYLTIPQGVDNDEIISIKDKGNIIDGIQGDVKVHLKVQPHDKFSRSGMNLIYKKEVSFKESLCGFEFVLEHINDKSMKLSSSRGNIIQNGDKKILKGLGFNRNDKQGDLIINFKVLHPPQKLTEEQLKTIDKIF
jgi:DnaJ-class molecular chaperone